MLRMVYKKEVVLNIRHRIEMCEQQEMFDDNVADKEFTPLEATFEYSHVHLGSRQHSLKIPLYAEDLQETLDFHRFGDSLAESLRDYARVEVYGSGVKGIDSRDTSITYPGARFVFALFNNILCVGQ